MPPTDQQWQYLDKLRGEGKLPPDVLQAMDVAGKTRTPAPSLSATTAIAIPTTPNVTTPSQPDPLAPKWDKISEQVPWVGPLLKDYGPGLERLVTNYGPTVLEYGAPIVAAVLTRGRSLPRQAATLGATVAGSHYLARTPAIIPTPGTPEATEAGKVAGESVRLGLETAGAMGLGGLIPAAAQTAGMARKALQGTARAVATGAGAGLGSLAAEPVDPSAHPLEHARDVLQDTAIFQGGLQAVGSAASRVLGRGRTLTPEGTAVADTLAERNRPIPATVSNSSVLHLLEHLGADSLGGGTRLRQAHALSETGLSDEIRDVLRSAAVPSDPGTRQALEAASGSTSTLYQRLFQRARDVAHTNNVPITLTNDERRQAFQVWGARGVAPGTPAHQALGALSTPAGLPPQQAQQILRELETFAQGPGKTMAAGDAEALDKTMVALKDALEHPAFVDTTPMRRTATQLHQQLKGTIDPGLETLLERVGEKPTQLSLRDANRLRSDLMSLARSQETGGQLRVPSATEYASLPGTGSRFGRQQQQQARQLAGGTFRAIEDATTALDPTLFTEWRQASAATRVLANAKQLQNVLAGPDVLDPSTNVYKGTALLNKLARMRGGEARLSQQFPEATPQLHQFGQALKLLQEVREGSSGRIGHMMLHRLGPLLAGAGTAVVTHNPYTMLPFLLVPSTLGMILQSPVWTRWLTLGMRAPVGSRQGLETLGKLWGVLQAEGLLTTPTTPPPPTGSR